MDPDVLIAWLRAFTATAALGAATICWAAAVRNHFRYGRKRMLLYALGFVFFTVGIETAMRVYVRVQAADGIVVIMDSWPWTLIAAMKAVAFVLVLVETVRQLGQRRLVN